MAKPPAPYDQLTLMFECAPHGGVERCLFFFPAGSFAIVPSWLGAREAPKRGVWVHGQHVRTFDNQGNVVRGEHAILCIAAQQQSIHYPAQITKIKPGPLSDCMCGSCVRLRSVQDLTKLLGESPETE